MLDTSAIADNQLKEPNLRDLAPLFFGLHIAGGHVGLPLLVLTCLLSKKVKRHPTIINFCLTWIIYSVSYSLLLYGRNYKDSHPPQVLCFVQSAVIYATPSMAAVAAFAVVLQVYGTFYAIWDSESITKLPHAAKMLLMLAPPYITLATISAGAGIIVWQHPDAVNAKNGIYCAIHVEAFERYTVPLFCGLVLVFVSVLEAAVLVKIYRRRRYMKRVCPDAEVRRPSLGPWLRLAVFVAYSWVAIGACISFLTAPEFINPFPYMAQAALPLAAMIVFGTQEDVARVWLPWLWKSRDDMQVLESRPPSISPRTSRTSGAHNLSNASDCDICRVPSGENEEGEAETQIAAVA
ncbi:hypothetical protein WOLCODRAFT_135422 [Wolfiporia cocos MD-104 SS10]|uniref:Fungal pheromone STE3G-protein-coupled receptor n=1 Tax=Wolfiporia cocos (strain MD-104) TaxID=742152 RepID=A0A2H3IVF3_WOLCO|nr:hypothetical protein WOLCODRAFT_135422 [Wolfiporia cocos MD-104 SS10]